MYPIADAVGLGLNVNEPTGIMVVDIACGYHRDFRHLAGRTGLGDLLHSGRQQIDESIITYA